MNILVTGGAGYIGSHTVLKLKENHHFVVVYDNLSKGHKKLIFSDKFIKGDIHNKKLLKKAIKKYRINAVMHFAAFIEAGESMISPSKYFNNNSVGTLSLLDAIIETKVKNFIFSSTAALYGYPDKIPIEEDSALVPVNVYGESKLIIEKILQWYSNIYNFNYVSLRYFNAAGADGKLRAGELHNPETHLIPLVIQTAFGERESFAIYGTNYDTPDGTCIRDYIHVSDIAEAHLLALEYLIEEKKSNIFNLGNGKGYSVKEIVDKVKKLSGKDFTVKEASSRPGDTKILVASSQRAREILNWNPEYTDIDQIITTAINFYKKSKHI